MKNIDDVRGYKRQIKFAETGGYRTGGGLPLTNCVIEVVGNDWEAQGPVLSLRFYYRPYPHQLAKEMAELGRPAYDGDTPIGIELALGPGLADSLIAQLQNKLPEFAQTVRDESDPGNATL